MVKKNFVTFLAFMIIAVPVSVHAEMTGKEIMQEQKKRHEVKSERNSQIMILVDKKKNKEKRLVKQFNKEFDKGLDRSLIVFLEPTDIKGTALLTWDQDERADDQWLYMPSTKKMQRIAAGSKKSYFMGTDYTYEDMGPEDIDNFNYTILRSEKMDGKDNWVIEAIPANDAKKKESAYAKRHLWIKKDIFFTVKVEYFDRRERLIKTQTIHDLVNVEGQIWRANKTLMDNKKKRHKTLVGIKKRELNVEIKDSVFSERYLKTEKHIE